MRALLVDYGAGNIHSIAKALERVGARVDLGDPTPRRLARADAIVLPGVGAFGAAARTLRRSMPSLRDALAGGTPCLGICLGMQLLFDGSEEGPGAGIGAIPGRVRRLRTRRAPHIGWNRAIGREGADDRFFYFAHGFVVEPADPSVIESTTRLEDEIFPATVRSGGMLGVQFHPEKSGAAGLDLLRDFVARVERRARTEAVR